MPASWQEEQGSLLVGRKYELERIEQSLRRLAAGAECTLLIEGEAGIGKTRLIEEATAQAQNLAIGVLHAVARELETDRPFGVFVDLLDLTRKSDDAAVAQLASLILGDGDGSESVSRGVPAPELRYRVIDEIVSVVDDRAADGPLLLAVEDLHWADASTLLTLDRLFRRPTLGALGLIASFRPSPRPPGLAKLVERYSRQQGEHVTLSALDEDAVYILAESILNGTPGARVIEQLRRAAGNPLFITELLGALRSEGGLADVDGEIDLTRVMLPPSFRVLILRRLAFLDDEVRDVLTIAAILGSSFSGTELAAGCARSMTELAEPIKHALDAGLLVETESGMAFRHDLVRDAIYYDRPQTVRKALHRDIGQRLADAGATTATVATHLALGAEVGDEAAISWLRRAAKDAAPRAPSIAVGLLQRAVDLCNPDEITYDELKTELVMATMWSGRFEEAEKLIRQIIADGPDPALAGILHFALGRVLVYQARANDSLGILEAALEDTRLPERQRGRLLGDLALRSMLPVNFTRAMSAAQEAIAIGRRLEDPLILNSPLCALSVAEAAKGNVSEAVQFAQEALPRSRRAVTEPVEAIQPRFYLGYALIDADRFDEAEALFQAALTFAHQSGTAWALPGCHYALAMRRFFSGDWEEALVEAETSVTIGEDVGTRLWVLPSQSIRAHIAIHRDDLRTAEEAIGAAMKIVQANGPAQMALTRHLWAAALFDEARGNTDAAYNALLGLWQLTASLGLRRDQRDIAPDLVRLAIAQGERARARSFVDEVVRIANAMQLPSAAGAAVRCLGLIDEDPEILLRSVDAYQRSPRRPEHAFACEDAAVALAHAGSGQEAEKLFEEALAIYTKLGAVRDEARAEARMRAAGLRRGRRGARRRPKTGWESLTETELKVIALITEGLTSRRIAERLFVSRYTVDTHVSHIFTKLGISSRVELASLAAQRGSGL